jgi:hypothetical protein
MSEAELHILKSRLQGGILNKARRGELEMPPNHRYLYEPPGNVRLEKGTGRSSAQINCRSTTPTTCIVMPAPCRALAAAGRQDGGVVVLGHGGKGCVQRRLEPQRLGNPGLQIVADHRLGDPTEEAERPHLAVDPVRQPLAKAKVRLEAPSTATKIWAA